MESILFNEENIAILKEIISKYGGRPEGLIEVLHQAQEAFGYIPKDVLVEIARGLNVPLTRVYGVVTFYNLFTMVPKGKHTISVCLGTSCYVRGGKRIMEHVKDLLQIEDGGTTEDRRFSLDVVRCVGACALSPVVTVDDDVYSHVTVTKIPEILSKYE
ncbi:MAG: NADH-quinone oxidoreductase subunit NuoE [Candidatus Bathyarchaeota archaeon]|nr:NADH-quinone oxidoreductase subunit NuoE [Candidatus Bathyarchaeota archaeon]MDH5790742.1 NADH-quinone oxidoreductase subunit NuoE [Candidatus Bathyarchaeota archaeon]